MTNQLTQSLSLAAIFFSGTMCAFGQTREEKVRGDKQKVEQEGYWHYNDLEKAYAEARETGKPIIAVLRCLPCEECVKLDDDLVESDPEVKPLLDQFVRVRIVGTNGLDLDTFQYDTDQSFAVFLMNADKTIYGRFGTRSHRTDWVGDVSLKGMARALEGALELHQEYPNNRTLLAAKRGKPLEFASPEKYPSLSDKFTNQLDYSGDVVKSCIHCHQIGDARREFYWHRSEAIPEELLFPYPHPKSIGLILDPDARAQVKAVTSDSIAETAGIQPGDQIRSLNKQPLLSMADVQWVLQQVPAEGGPLQAKIQRGTQTLDIDIRLPEGWRRLDDISWRVSSWPMRRIAAGGMNLAALDNEERNEAGINEGMALRVRSLGKYGPHGTARKQGFLEGDILVGYDGQSHLRREGDVFAYANDHLKPGQTISIEFLRDGKKQTLELPIQK